MSKLCLQPLAVVKILIIQLPWSEEEDELLAERFGNDAKITQLEKLHSRTYGAIKVRLLKLELLIKPSNF